MMGQCSYLWTPPYLELTAVVVVVGLLLIDRPASPVVVVVAHPEC